MVTRPWQIYGPFELDKHNEASWEQLFQEALYKHEHLDCAIGVYVIAISNRNRDRIKYIGMTHSQDFTREVFSQANKIKVWNDIITLRSRTIRLWLFAKPNEDRAGYSTDNRLYKQAHLLEELLIMHAQAAGHELINIKKIKSAEGLAVEGMFGVKKRAGAKTKAAKTLSTCLKFS